MKKKKLICVVIALVILLGGVVMGYLGLRGQGEYNHVSEMLGTGKPETINYIQDPALLTAISYEQDPEALRAFMVGDLGLDEASVDAAIEARQVYAEKQAESQAFDTFSAYLKEQDPTLTDEGVQDLIKDRETSDPMRAEMLKQSVMTELGIDEAAYEALASDTAILDLMREGLPNLMIGDREKFDAITAACGWTTADTMRAICLPDEVTALPEALTADGALRSLLVDVLGKDGGTVDGELADRETYKAAAETAATTAAAIDLAPLTSAFTAVQNGAVPGVTLEEGEETAEADLIAYVAETLGVEAGSASTARELLISHLSTLLGVDVTDAAYDVIARDGKLDAADLEKAIVTASTGFSPERYDVLKADPDGLQLALDSMDGMKANNLFNNAITYLFIGIVLIIFGGAWLFILSLDRSRSKGVKKPMSASQRRTVDFLLNYALYIILLMILVIVCIIRPTFLDITNVLNIVKQASTKGILALGCAGLIVLAGTDLSIGRVLGLSAAVTASIVQSSQYASRMFPQITTPVMLFVPLLASIAVACLFTFINGFGVSKLHLHAFIVTLGTQLIAQGATCIYIESQPSGTAQALSTFDNHFLDVAAGNLTIGTIRIPLVVIYFLAIAVIMWFVWNKTRLGKNMFAVGGNEEAAAVSGVNVAKTIMLVYLIAGVLYGISAFLEAARITSVGANTGLNYETDAISACVVGGVSFSGGVGTIQGVVIGAVVLQAINYSLQFLGVNPYLQYIIRGLIIILAVSIDVRKYLVKK